MKDFDTWKRVIDSHRDAHRAAGLTLRSLARDITDPNNVFFTFECETLERARGFIDDPEAAKAGATSGVLDGEYHFANSVS